MNILKAPIKGFLENLVAACQGINSIWWIGSRPNKLDVRSDSDWDFLVFAESSTYQLIKSIKEFQEKADTLLIDLMVEKERNIFRSVWGKPKKLDVNKDLRWKQITDTKAKYYGTKLIKIKRRNDILLSEWERYAKAHGADIDSKDISKWLFAYRMWPE